MKKARRVDVHAERVARKVGAEIAHVYVSARVPYALNTSAGISTISGGRVEFVVGTRTRLQEGLRGREELHEKLLPIEKRRQRAEIREGTHVVREERGALVLHGERELQAKVTTHVNHTSVVKPDGLVRGGGCFA